MDAALRLEPVYMGILLILSFNPCFSGCRPATLSNFLGYSAHFSVSILVLVDAALRRNAAHAAGSGIMVSILVLVDAALRQWRFSAVLRI